MSREWTTRSSLLNQLLLHFQFKLWSTLALYLAKIIYTLPILSHFTKKNLRKLNYYYICYSLFYLRICHTISNFYSVSLQKAKALTSPLTFELQPYHVHEKFLRLNFYSPIYYQIHDRKYSATNEKQKTYSQSRIAK